MASIFISHSSVDRVLVRRIVELLEGGIGIPCEQVFCTSMPGHVGPGLNSNTTIREELRSAVVLLPIVSEAFSSSTYCMFELGASWMAKKSIIPILVPPMTYKDMAPILESTQAVRLNEPIDLTLLRDALLKSLDLQGRATAEWESRRDSFLADLPALLKRGQNWLYALRSIRPEGVHEVVGCFRIVGVRGRANIIKATGRAYWVSPRVSIRGEWTTDEAAESQDQLLFTYLMKSPPDGEALQVAKPEVHEGVLRLSRRDDFEPIIGEICFSGYVHDLFAWRDNTPSMYAERVSRLAWDQVISYVELHGREVFESFARRLGAK